MTCSFNILLHHQSKFIFMYSNSDFIFDDFTVTRHKPNNFDSTLLDTSIETYKQVKSLFKVLLQILGRAEKIE